MYCKCIEIFFYVQEPCVCVIILVCLSMLPPVPIATLLYSRGETQIYWYFQTLFDDVPFCRYHGHFRPRYSVGLLKHDRQHAAVYYSQTCTCRSRERVMRYPSSVLDGRNGTRYTHHDPNSTHLLLSRPRSPHNRRWGPSKR